MSLPLVYQSHGRRLATGIVVLCVWAALLAAYMLLDAALIVMLPLAAFTLPALYDLVANPIATFRLDAQTLEWRAGRQHVQIAIEEIDHLRLDTRLDLSVRLSVVRPSGQKIRVPHPATPPHRTVEAAAKDAGIAVQRHHFTLFG